MKARGITRYLSGTRAAIAAAAIAASANIASAALNVEITVNGFGPGGGAGSPGKTIVLSPGDVGTPISLSVWGTVTGGDNTSTANDGLQSLCANFRSFGPMLGNLANLTLDSDFDDNGSSGGAQFGTPGDFDLGSLNAASASGWWTAIAREVQSATGPSSDGSGNLLLGTITFTPTDLSSMGTTLLQVDYRHAAQGALWFEDATITPMPDPTPDVWTNDKNPSSGTVTVGQPITIVPEPASLALLAATSTLLLRRPRGPHLR
jgi:hypothetical protein